MIPISPYSCTSQYIHPHRRGERSDDAPIHDHRGAGGHYHGGRGESHPDTCVRTRGVKTIGGEIPQMRFFTTHKTTQTHTHTHTTHTHTHSRPNTMHSTTHSNTLQHNTQTTRHNTQQNAIQNTTHNATKQNTTQGNTPQHNTTHNTRHNT